jgi:hypothetical protein
MQGSFGEKDVISKRLLIFTPEESFIDERVLLV